jgi:glycerol-3-phosphate acyltransferase PlsY
MMTFWLMLGGYLLGSIPVGYLIVRWKSGADVRQAGSGATGATNVTRQAGRTLGLLTLFLDALKGALAVWLARAVLGEEGTSWAVAGAGTWAVIGHCFPVWLRFRAGKGAATALGVFLAIVPLTVLASLGIFIGTIWWTRYVSLGSILAAAFVPLATAVLHWTAWPNPDFGPVITSLCLVSGLIIARHAENIRRLRAGTESRFGSSPGAAPSS